MLSVFCLFQCRSYGKRERIIKNFLKSGTYYIKAAALVKKDGKYKTQTFSKAVSASAK